MHSRKTLDVFRQTVRDHYHANPRPMPWRETNDPYRILVSEIMLQQTQVSRVLSKYEEFLSVFPTISDLAKAPLPLLLSVWRGLGYNRRALSLKRCAENIMQNFDGTVPSSIAELESLPGIGHYTARAVAAFAYSVATPFIETNIRTVYIHCFFQDSEAVHDREILPLVTATLDHENPRGWYYALMDYGVMLKQQHPNPGRRSRHHVRQSPFEGSNRQLRSRMLTTVLDNPGITALALSELLVHERSAVDANLDALLREGFLEKRGKGIRVPEGIKNG